MVRERDFEAEKFKYLEKIKISIFSFMLFGLSLIEIGQNQQSIRMLINVQYLPLEQVTITALFESDVIHSPLLKLYFQVVAS